MCCCAATAAAPVRFQTHCLLWDLVVGKGVARPVDDADPNLTAWAKDPNNPISFPGMRGGYAGPSNLWRAKPGGPINMAMALGRSVARFETTDPRLHNWTVANPRFLPYGANNGHGTTGIMFFPLPKRAPDAATSSRTAVKELP
eukprot:SAG31_NODE_10965_length_1078_cov_1.002043_2_plen_143_part_01